MSCADPERCGHPAAAARDAAAQRGHQVRVRVLQQGGGRAAADARRVRGVRHQTGRGQLQRGRHGRGGAGGAAHLGEDPAAVPGRDHGLGRAHGHPASRRFLMNDEY